MGAVKRVKKAVKKRVKKVWINVGKKNSGVMSVYRKLNYINRSLKYYKQYALCAVDDKTIVFSTFKGRQFSCSPRAIFEEMQRQGLDYNYIWIMRKPKRYEWLEEKYPNTKVVKYGSKEFYKAHAKAKIWCFNSRHLGVIPLRKGQIYLQCWHGTPLKKLGCDIEAKEGNALYSVEEIHRDYEEVGHLVTYFLSPSAFCTEKFMSAFDIKDPNVMIEEGYPRNDFLSNYTDEDLKRVKEYFGIPEGKKIILYAPTWRDNSHEAGVGYTLDLGIDFDYVQEQLQDEYVILFRTHYFVANKFDLNKYEGFIFNASSYNDINDLYIVSDLLITDYSSVFFDYANLRRPMFFYMYDFEEYKNDIRDFYIDLDELPGPISMKQEDLIRDIKNVDTYMDTYREKYQKFHDKFNYLDDGHAAARVVERCILNHAKDKTAGKD